MCESGPQNCDSDVSPPHSLAVSAMQSPALANATVKVSAALSRPIAASGAPAHRHASSASFLHITKHCSLREQQHAVLRISRHGCACRSGLPRLQRVAEPRWLSPHRHHGDAQVHVDVFAAFG